jgi:hypothetical protein
LAASSDSNFSNLELPDDEIVEEDDEDDIPVFSFDVDAPCVDIGVVFPDVNQCKSALTQHAILNDYAFRTVKKDKTRFRAKCLRAHKGCKWFFCICQQEIPWMQGTSGSSGLYIFFFSRHKCPVVNKIVHVFLCRLK